MNRRLVSLIFTWSSVVSVGDTTAATLQDFLTKHGYTAIPLQSPVVKPDVPTQLGEANHLFANGKVNGRTLVVMIDTGATVLSIDTTAAEGMKQVQKLPETVEGAFGALKTPGAAVSIGKIEFGPVTYEAEPAALVNLRGKKATYVDRLVPRSGHVLECDLIVGWEFLSRHDAIIDYQGPTLFLRESEPSADFGNTLGRSLLAGGFVLVPLTSRNSQIEVPAIINGHPALLLLDTGAVVTVLDKNQTRALEAGVREKVMELVDVGGKHRDLDFTKVQSLRISDFTLENTIVGVTDLQPTNESRARSDMPAIQGVLGPEILSRGHAIIDCANLRLYLYSPNREPVKKQ